LLYINRYLYIFFIFTVIYSENIIATTDIEHLLTEYNQKNRASSKTIDENKGNLILFTREDIEKMHASRLKDIFKTLPLIYYHENRYALPDPMTSGMFEPYRSSYIRVYIDGVEVTQGWAGSGLVLYGDINIDFADHIEFYYTTPSYESSTEPAYMTIYIYSKDASTDSGVVAKISQGSRGYGEQSVNYGDKVGDVSYMINFAHTDAKREKIDNGTSTPLSRDFTENQLFAYIKNDTQTFHIQILDKDTDSLAGASWDATPIESTMDYLNVHMDYVVQLNSAWKLTVAYDWLKTDFDEEDDYPLMTSIAQGSNSIHGYAINDTFTTELTYKQNIQNHHLLAGIKGRYKRLQSIKLDGESSFEPDFSLEKIYSVFLQDQYVIDDKQLLSIGVSCTHIDRNANVSSDDLLQYRLGYIYNNNNLTYKTYIFRTEFAIEPTMRSFGPDNFNGLEPQRTYGISSEFNYQTLYKKIRLGLIYMEDKNSILQLGLSDTTKNTKYYIALLDSEYKFDINNKIAIFLYAAHYKHIYSYDDLDDISAYLSFFNSYKNIDFYNGFVWHINSLDWKNYIDWTSTISWNIKENISITLKGDNILGKAKETNIFRFDPSKTPEMLMEPLHISPIDRSFSINVEYRF